MTKVWDISYYIEHLGSQPPPGSVELLTFLAAALNDRGELFKLDQIELWKNQPAIALDASWPEK